MGSPPRRPPTRVVCSPIWIYLRYDWSTGAFCFFSRFLSLSRVLFIFLVRLFTGCVFPAFLFSFLPVIDPFFSFSYAYACA